jgi:uncharacterized caspase-like protein
MPLLSNFLATLGILVVFTIGAAPSSARAEQRIALVLGNAAYEAGALKTTANDAGLVAQTLEAAGFEVVGARDLDHDALRRAFRDFLDKAGALGPDDVALLYLGGYGLQLEGENYFVPTDARIERASDVAVQAVRISDYTRALAALKLKVSIVVLDLARSHPFALSGEPVAGGLALVEPEPGMLIAFNAAPGTIAPAAQGAYGTYAQALAEMMREGGLPLEAVFDRVRLRVSDGTQGAQSGTPPTLRRLLSSSSARPMPPPLPLANRAAGDISGISVRRGHMSQPWNATRCRIIWSFWIPIRMIRLRTGYGPLLPHGARH